MKHNKGYIIEQILIKKLGYIHMRTGLPEHVLVSVKVYITRYNMAYMSKATSNILHLTMKISDLLDNPDAVLNINGIPQY